jgi:hypothetical protein
MSCLISLSNQQLSHNLLLEQQLQEAPSSNSSHSSHSLYSHCSHSSSLNHVSHFPINQENQQLIEFDWDFIILANRARAANPPRPNSPNLTTTYPPMSCFMPTTGGKYWFKFGGGKSRFEGRREKPKEEYKLECLVVA